MATKRPQEDDLRRKPTAKVIRRRTVHVLTAVTVNGPQVYPVELHRDEMKVFSSLARAERVLRSSIAADTVASMYDDAEYPVVLYEIREKVLDARSSDSHVRTRIYERDGTLRGSVPYFTSGPRGGRPTGGFRFRVGDLVECDVGTSLHLGIVASQPLTPEAMRARWEPLLGAGPERLEKLTVGSERLR